MSSNSCHKEAFTALSVTDSNNAGDRTVKTIDIIQESVSNICKNFLMQRSILIFRNNDPLLESFEPCKLLSMHSTCNLVMLNLCTAIQNYVHQFYLKISAYIIISLL